MLRQAHHHHHQRHRRHHRHQPSYKRHNHNAVAPSIERTIGREDNDVFSSLPQELHDKIFNYVSSASSAAHHQHHTGGGSSSNNPTISCYHSCMLVNRYWNELFMRSCTSLNLVRYTERISDSVLGLIVGQCPFTVKMTLGAFGKQMPATPAGLEQIASLSRLRNLNFVSCTLSLSTMKTLAERLKCLNSLNITWCTISDQAVEQISSFSSLDHLSLQDAHITDVGLTHLERLVQLSSLNLSFCSKITDRGIVRLAKRTKRMESLNLSWCLEITDLSLQHVGTNLQRLKLLSLTGCKKISMDGKNFIRRQIPDCKVFSDSSYVPFKRIANF